MPLDSDCWDRDSHRQESRQRLSAGSTRGIHQCRQASPSRETRVEKHCHAVIISFRLVRLSDVLRLIEISVPRCSKPLKDKHLRGAAM